jgi:hypothetical protein
VPSGPDGTPEASQVPAESSGVAQAGPATAGDAVSADGEEESAEEQDMAEKFFPKDTERMGVRASVIALMTMLAALVAAIHIILGCRLVST